MFLYLFYGNTNKVFKYSACAGQCGAVSWLKSSVVAGLDPRIVVSVSMVTFDMVVIVSLILDPIQYLGIASALRNTESVIILHHGTV